MNYHSHIEKLKKKIKKLKKYIDMRTINIEYQLNEVKKETQNNKCKIDDLIYEVESITDKTATAGEQQGSSDDCGDARVDGGKMMTQTSFRDRFLDWISQEPTKKND